MESFQGIWFGHAFFKVCQYASTKKKVSMGLKHVSMKFAQVDLQNVYYMFLKVKERNIGMDEGLHYCKP
jgi:hypothetical protein